MNNLAPIKNCPGVQGGNLYKQDARVNLYAIVISNKLDLFLQISTNDVDFFGYKICRYLYTRQISTRPTGNILRRKSLVSTGTVCNTFVRQF